MPVVWYLVPLCGTYCRCVVLIMGKKLHNRTTRTWNLKFSLSYIISPEYLLTWTWKKDVGLDQKQSRYIIPINELQAKKLTNKEMRSNSAPSSTLKSLTRQVFFLAVKYLELKTICKKTDLVQILVHFKSHPLSPIFFYYYYL